MISPSRVGAAVETDEAPTVIRSGLPMLALLRVKNFRMLWLGEAISYLGDQCYFIALPWLVLRLTGDGLAMGAVLAVQAIPRALLMLVGGAYVDRFTPRAVMLASNLLRLVLVSLLAALVFGGFVNLWLIYAFALAFGLADAFFFPAQSSIVAQLLDKDQLQAGNALLQATGQLSIFLGPVAAGALIAALDKGATGGQPDLHGIGIAMALDALSFLASALALWRITSSDRTMRRSARAAEGVLGAIREGLGVVWHDVALRYFFALVAAINFFVTGPIAVGIPVLAATRFPEGAVAFGIIISAYGGGSLLGTALAGALPKPSPQSQGPLLLVVMSFLGVGLAILGVVHSTLVAALIMIVTGAANGYVVIIFVSWLQRRTPEAILGRVMSVLIFASVGLSPLSIAVAGIVVDQNVALLFVVSGATMSCAVLLAALSPTLRRLWAESV